MTYAESILELLDDVFPMSYCDDCLAIELGIQPRQQVNQIGRKLVDMRKTIRRRGTCSNCKKIKTTNEIVQSESKSQSNEDMQAVRESQAAYSVSDSIVGIQQIDIEHARTEVVRICHNIWRERKFEDPPHSISTLINTLRSEYIIPNHQANMMLTLCSLRNVYVYENVKLGPREKNIVENAYSIIQEWWRTVRH